MIHHITREITPVQMPDCVHFYGFLGFESVPMPPALEGRAVWLGRPDHADGVQLHLLMNDTATPQLGHVAFLVTAYADTVARLREAGFEVEPRTEHWGSPRSYVRDPASNLVELMEWAPDERRQ
jgi:catechol 2,3-dioxygenase-like lactoylglutathione lyase family enzyme